MSEDRKLNIILLVVILFMFIVMTVMNATTQEWKAEAMELEAQIEQGYKQDAAAMNAAYELGWDDASSFHRKRLEGEGK